MDQQGADSHEQGHGNGDNHKDAAAIHKGHLGREKSKGEKALQAFFYDALDHFSQIIILDGAIDELLTAPYIDEEKGMSAAVTASLKAREGMPEELDLESPTTVAEMVEAMEAEAAEEEDL